MNPPFGIQGKIKDKDFLDKALEISNSVFSFHSSNSLSFLEKHYIIEKYLIVDFPIKRLFWFHNKKRKNIGVLIGKFIDKRI
jgi:putative methylase